ncbi:MAG: hypothetical protein U9N39_04245 [Campylobacterota bacterium]|nr:hypothetical protein [Campylobacterota bacterium]
MIKSTFLYITLLAFLLGCNSKDSSTQSQELQENNTSIETNTTTRTKSALLVNVEFKSNAVINNRAAYVTSQCYTKTVDENNQVHNPCFSCHINSKEPNYIDDADLQTSYDFSEYTKKNRFTNLFKDRTKEVVAQSDKEILSYVRQNNYKDENGTLILKQRLDALPLNWDVNEDSVWNGYTPDCYFDFDADGFDRDANGEYTLWRAFAYHPFLGTFWPTNGSTDDVLIRLDSLFSQNEAGEFDIEVYKLNLSIVESLIKETNITIDETNESLYGVDLNQNGVLDMSQEIVFNWQTPEYNTTTRKIGNFSISYVGKAKKALEDNSYLIAPGLYPKNTEFLHSVRYIDFDENQNVTMASRMKELRYAKKVSWNSYSQLLNASLAEIKERDAFPERLRNVQGDSEKGLQTGLGWVYQGFIEDENGELRPQNYEETLYCIGCHSGIGAIADSTFVYQRKLGFDAHANGWYHWTQDIKGFTNMREPLTKDGRYEYSLYLSENGAGDEFRDNEEIFANYFENGVLKQDKLDELHGDISKLILPSAKRALELNKAYRVIVEEQSYIYGRDAHVKPVENVHKELEMGQDTQVDMININ